MQKIQYHPSPDSFHVSQQCRISNCEHITNQINANKERKNWENTKEKYLSHTYDYTNSVYMGLYYDNNNTPSTITTLFLHD